MRIARSHDTYAKRLQVGTQHWRAGSRQVTREAFRVRWTGLTDSRLVVGRGRVLLQLSGADRGPPFTGTRDQFQG